MKHGLLVLTLLALVLAGCKPDRPKTVRITGRVFFAGARPPAAGTIAFAAIEAAPGFPLRAGMGGFDAEGNVSATTYQEGDGLVPGRYEMKLECWRTPPSELAAGDSYVPADFRAGELEVPADASGPVTVTLDVPTK